MSSNDTHNETRVAVRIPSRLASQIRALAARDMNGMSSTIRRLLAAAVAREQGTAEARCDR